MTGANLSQDFIGSIIETVRHCAKAEILPRFRHPELLIDTKSSPYDLVTDADVAMENALERSLLRVLPNAQILGEEAASNTPDLVNMLHQDGPTFVIDPIDGTWNFANSLANFGVALALVKDGITEFGLLYDPVADDWIMAQKGCGTWFGRPGEAPRRLQPPSRSNGGFVHLDRLSTAKRVELFEVAAKFGRATTLQCSVHEYRTMLLGLAGYSLNTGLHPWDHLAGMLAIEEVGGVAKMLSGAPYSPHAKQGKLLVAQNPELWDALAEGFAPVFQVTE